MDTSKKNTPKNSKKRSRPSSQKGSPNRKTTKRVKVDSPLLSRSSSTSSVASSKSNSKTRKSHSVEYEVLPDEPIDFEQWVHVAKIFIEKVHQKLFKPRFSIMAYNAELQKPMIEIAGLAAELYAKLHGIIALELDVPIQCGDVLHAPNVGTGNLIYGTTERAKELLKEDIERLTNKQKIINEAYTKALMANRTEVELQGPDSDAAKFPPVPPEVNPILFAYINAEIYDKAMKDRMKIASQEFYINVSDAAKKYKKELSKIITIYERNQMMDNERENYSNMSEELQTFYREYLLISIMLDQDVDVPSVQHEGDANEIRKKTIKRLCRFYKTLPETPNFDETSFKLKNPPPKYVQGNLKNAIQYVVDPKTKLVQFRRATDPEFKFSLYSDVAKTHAAIMRGEDPNKQVSPRNKTSKKHSK